MNKNLKEILCIAIFLFSGMGAYTFAQSTDLISRLIAVALAVLFFITGWYYSNKIGNGEQDE